jgi:hypothetical protein
MLPGASRLALNIHLPTSQVRVPSTHRFVLELDADWLLKQAEAVGPQTTQYLTALMRARAFPEQAYRSCLGVLSLARKYSQLLVETACQRLLEAHLLSYHDQKSELEALSRPSNPTTDPPPIHENIQGETYPISIKGDRS